MHILKVGIQTSLCLHTKRYLWSPTSTRYDYDVIYDALSGMVFFFNFFSPGRPLEDNPSEDGARAEATG
jgi:hypothetical protein